MCSCDLGIALICDGSICEASKGLNIIATRRIHASSYTIHDHMAASRRSSFVIACTVNVFPTNGTWILPTWGDIGDTDKT